MSELARLRALLEAATPGPWEQLGDSGFLRSPGFVDYDGELSPEDAGAIAALGTLWPDLLAVVEASSECADNLPAPALEVWARLDRRRDALDALDARIREVLGDEGGEA